MSHEDNIDPAHSTQNLDEATLRDWVAKLELKKIHPVLIFGTTYSGKTTMLQSLLFYARNSPNSDVDISYGEPVALDNDAVWRERINEGRAFYELGVTEFGNQKVAGPTQKTFPFFVPVDIVVRGERLKFAFLEGNGEWYQRKQVIDANASIFEDFRSEISSLIRLFRNPISVLFVAPATVGSRELQNVSDEGLTNCIEKYKDRKNGAGDNLLLLLTKWDTLCDPEDKSGEFSDVTANDFLKKIEGRRFLWTKFSSFHLMGSASKAVMPYSAGWIKDNIFVPYDRRHQPIFDKFNRTLWNWLYGNATAARGDGSAESREVLYGDVDIRRRGAARYYLTLASTLLWIRARRPGEG